MHGAKRLPGKLDLAHRFSIERNADEVRAIHHALDGHVEGRLAGRIRMAHVQRQGGRRRRIGGYQWPEVLVPVAIHQRREVDHLGRGLDGEGEARGRGGRGLSTDLADPSSIPTPGREPVGTLT